MKQLIILTLFVTVSFSTNAQLEEREKADWKLIGQLKFGGITKSKIEYINHGEDTTYFLFIKDVRDTPKDNYFGITFKNTNGTFGKFYAILKSFFLPENKKNKDYSRTFELGNTGVNVSHKRLITSQGIMFYTKEGYIYWSEKDIDKLFGKN